MRIGILGAGAIGGEVARAADGWNEVSEVLLHDIVAERAERLAAALRKGRTVSSGKELVKGADIVVETATADAARALLPQALAAGRQVMTLSIGALVDEAFFAECKALARMNGSRLYLPSGAIAGIDGLKAASLAKVKSVTLVTTKPPKGLGVEADKWTLLFEGSARDAIERFPKNVNVAVALSLAGIGADETKVQVVADPLATRNSHKIIFDGDFGRIRVEVENLPHPENPATSYLASLSAIATLRRMLDPVQMGA